MFVGLAQEDEEAGVVLLQQSGRIPFTLALSCPAASDTAQSFGFRRIQIWPCRLHCFVDICKHGTQKP